MLATYVIPAEPGIHEKVRLRFRTARDDAQEVCLISGGEALQMQKVSSGEVFDYYETEVQLTDTMFVYYFRIKSDVAYRNIRWNITISGSCLDFPHRHGQKAL